MNGWVTALCLVLSAFVGCGIGYGHADKRCKEDLEHYERALQMVQMCSTQWTGDYKRDYYRHVAVSAACKEMMSR